MALVHYICHPDVVVDPNVPVPDWGLSECGFVTMARLAELGQFSNVKSIWCSAEQKAVDGARVLAKRIGLGFEKLASLGENDRSATGYLPKDEFEKVVDEFFGEPAKSVRGWEVAKDAQRRIVEATESVCRQSPSGDIAIVAHGGVGNLLYCKISNLQISREHAAPGMGSWFSFDRDSWDLKKSWVAA